MYCIVICLRWWFEYYIIKKTRVIHHKGVICESTQKHNCERIESITVEQDFWGRIMNHGDIRINEPPMQQEIIMYGIPEPKKNVDIVCDLLFEKESDKRFRT